MSTSSAWSGGSSRDRRRPARPGRDLRHDAARRQPARGRLADRRRQAAHRRPARLAGRRLDRGRLARRQPQGRRVLRPRRHRAAARHQPAGGLRLHPPREGRGRQRRDAAQAARRRHRDRLHRRQVLGLPRDRGAADLARRGGGHGRRLHRVPAGRGAARCSSTPSTPSTGTAQPGVQPPGARGRGHGGGRVRGPVRHQRRLAPVRRGRGRRRRGVPPRRPRGRAPPRRRRMRGGQRDSPAYGPAPPRSRAPSTGTASAPATAT